MGRAVAIGSGAEVGGLALAGVEVRLAATPEEARLAWAHLLDDGDQPPVTLVILDRATADAVGERRPDGPLTVVVPDAQA